MASEPEQEQDPYATERAQLARGARATKFSAVSLGASFLSLLLPVMAPVPAVIYFSLIVLSPLGLGLGAAAVISGHRYWTPVLLGIVGFTLALMFPALLALSVLRGQAGAT